MYIDILLIITILIIIISIIVIIIIITWLRLDAVRPEDCRECRPQAHPLRLTSEACPVSFDNVAMIIILLKKAITHNTYN